VPPQERNHVSIPGPNLSAFGFSTKNREPFLRNDDLREQLHAYQVGICQNLGCPSLQIGGVEDHVHILCRFGKSIEVQDFLRDLKRDSSKWVKTQEAGSSDFHWQGGYGAFSISPSHVDPLKKYIINQKEHHRHETYQDEYRRLCKKYGLDIDERYVWD
jgi:REP element-mobilizing transposase RayT